MTKQEFREFIREVARDTRACVATVRGSEQLKKAFVHDPSLSPFFEDANATLERLAKYCEMRTEKPE